MKKTQKRFAACCQWRLKCTEFSLTTKFNKMDKTSNLPQNPPLQQTAVSGSRLSGKTNAMILSMIPELKAGGKVGVAGCKDPKDITKRLKAYGIEVQSEPMIATQPMKAIHNLNSIEGEIIGIEYGKKIQTGFLFYCH